MNINYDLLGQILSVFGLFFTSFSYFQKNEKRLKILMTISGVFWIASFYFVGAYTAFYISLLNTFRQFLTWIFHDANSEKNMKISILFIFLNILISIHTWQGIISIFPTLASIIATYSTFSLKDKKMRLGLLLNEICWLVNSSYFLNIGGIVCCSINIPVLLKQILNDKFFNKN